MPGLPSADWALPTLITIGLSLEQTGLDKSVNPRIAWGTPTQAYPRNLEAAHPLRPDEPALGSLRQEGHGLDTKPLSQTL